ncbi:Ala-tRNA(Pro) hydrolase [Stella humosa]|uniref:Ala-tRNA(Pro) hydrolase n=1 Tax=Stella humosa TaxID=94 RepID=A0A3N1KZP3_9PROT|nr:prolyl-tRNA synthetase associated domain-containing protein [Stella humosa]ROP84259.1 Ala-tRNA(Pro) hydrolase [Stella humosa]BBK33772.1 DNA-binding protein [Stella humosa]
MTDLTEPAAPALAPGPHHATPERLLARLGELGIQTRTVEHPPLYTVEESRRLRGDLPGGHCKNLFLKDRKDQLWLVVTLEDRPIEMKSLSDRIGSARLSFGRPELLVEALGVTPGAVTPFSLINDPAQRVTVVLDRGMLDLDPLNYHPLTNRATTAIAPADLLRFIAACGHTPRIVDLA